MIKQNPKISAIKMVEHLKNNLDIDVSVSTVCNFIRSHGYYDRVSRKKYYVSEVNRKKD